MPFVPEEKKEEQKAIIRRVITMSPSISVLRLQKTLADSSEKLELSYPYLCDLVKEVRADRLKELDEETKESLYKEVADLVEFVNQQLRSIAQEEKLVYMKKKTDGLPSESAETRIFAQNNRIKALNSLIDNSMRLVQLKMDLGIIERKHGTMEFRVIDMMAALKKIRNGNYTTPLNDLIGTGNQPPVTGPVVG